MALKGKQKASGSAQRGTWFSKLELLKDGMIPYDTFRKRQEEAAKEQELAKRVYPDRRPRILLDSEAKDILFNALNKARKEIGDTFDEISDAKRVESILLSERDRLLKSAKSPEKRRDISAVYGRAIHCVGVKPD